MVTPSYRLINPQVNRSFVFKWEPFNLTTRWHYHPELELVYFISGQTSGIIGDGFQHFDEGDLILMGSNFPHVLLEHKELNDMEKKSKPFGLIIQFAGDFLGTAFMQKPELALIQDLLIKKARRGIRFNKATVERVREILLNMHCLSEPRKLISLLDTLQTLAEARGYHYLTHEDYVFDYTVDEERMRNIRRHIYEHFTEKITVKDMAGVANMTETSFCRYFKTRTLKNFTTFLNEVRISYACKILTNDNCSVTGACFQCGFNELSYFTRQFKKIMKVPPQQYQKWKMKI